MTLEQIAEMTHEANLLYCRSLGDLTQVSWKDAPQWQKEAAIDGVRFLMDNKYATPESSHENWMRRKQNDGWCYGSVKDPVKKEHPCIVAYRAMPETQRRKDHLFHAIVKALLKEI